MKTSLFDLVRRQCSAVGIFTLLLAATFFAATAFGEEKAAAAAKPAADSSAKPSEEEMMKMMMEMSKPNENHKLLADMAGKWDYTIKMWMDPDPKAEPTTSTGTAERTPIMDGRYFQVDVSGKMDMPGPDGKMMPMEFKGTGLEGYDNIKKKFVSSWADNMGTGIIMSEGTYDPATKTFTYNAECEMMPGQMTKIREVLKIIDKDHHVFEWYDNMHNDGKTKSMEITYTRKK